MTQTAPTSRLRRPGADHEAEIQARLRKASGQLSGVAGMHADGRYCVDVLDQLSAVSAAVDAVALLVLTDHVNSCVREAIEAGDPEEKVAELLAALRRYVRNH
ncbi:metal-sensitive transcriptional regulator [Sporichthya polymorpha]|uniref:metal-sensitive transcriptional regulator n=1 Tax=Sporichthya polymorpha TaxID=35751 RepID=UPI000527EC57|nr:metal-sensitive transcriptional regulator [Sporichthya polymorpha]